MPKSLVYTITVLIWALVISLVYSLFNERLEEQYSDLEDRIDTLLLTSKGMALLNSRVLFYENFNSYEYAKLLKRVSTSSSKPELDSAKELFLNLASPLILSKNSKIASVSFYSSDGVFINSVSKTVDIESLQSDYFDSLDGEYSFFLQKDGMYSFVQKVYFQGSLAGYIILNTPAISSLRRVFRQEGFDISISHIKPQKSDGCNLKGDRFTCSKPIPASQGGGYYIIEGIGGEFVSTQNALFFWLLTISAFFVLLLFFVYRSQKTTTVIKELNETLSNQNRFLQTIIDAIPSPIFVKDSELKYIMVNKAMVEFFARNSKSEMLGKSDRELLNDKKIIENFFKQDSLVLKDKKSLFIEVEELFFASESTTKWYQTTKIPLIGVGYPKSEDMLLGISTDITHLEKLKRELSEVNQHLNIKISQEVEERLRSEKRFKELFENIGDVIVAIRIEDNHYKIEEANISALKFFGRSKEDITTSNLEQIISFDGMDAFFNDIVSLGMLEEKREIFIDKQSLIVELKARVYIHNSRKTILLSIRDVTEHEKLKRDKKEQERLMAQQAKMAEMGDMIGAIAHQWRQPLNSINAAAVKLKMHSALDSLTPKSVEEATSFIEEQSDKMSDTISDFLNFFKPSREKEYFCLKEVINNIKKMLGVQLENRNIELKCNIQNDIEVYGYKNELEHIILNLVVNARDAFEGKNIKDCWIRVDAKRVDKKVVLSVEDSAGGIPQNIMDKIFNPYFSTKPTNKGTGIGLYMAKSILEKGFGGDITVSNTEYGAKFIMEF